jgi:hypothetical protein
VVRGEEKVVMKTDVKGRITGPALITLGSLSNCVETATGWYKPQEHFSPVDVHVFQAIG